MRRKTTLLFIGILLAAGASAQTVPSTPDGDLPAELARLTKSVREIADLLAKQTETQRLDLFMKRIELSSARVGQLEQSLRSLQSERTSLEEQSQGMELELQRLQAHAESGGTEVPHAELESATKRAEALRKRFGSRLQALGQEIAELEGRLSTQREELREWQRVVDRRLSSF